MDGISGVDDDLAGEAVGVLDDQRLGRDPGCGQDYHLGPDERLGDAPDIALGVAGRVARSVNHRVTLRPQGASEGLPDITRADNGCSLAPLLLADPRRPAACLRASLGLL